MFNNEDLTSKSVDEWLDGVDYSIDYNYQPSLFALKLIEFIKQVNGEKGEENKSPVLHYHVLDQLGKIKPNEIQVRIANMIHRGAAKTTLMRYLILYLAAFRHIDGFGQITLMLYVSDSVDNGVKNMRKNLEYTWDNSPFLKMLIPSIRFTDIRWEFTNHDGQSFLVKAYGASTGVRGTQELNVRPQLAVLDDLVSDEDARSLTVMETIKTTVSNAIEFALHPRKNMIIWCGTPFNANDPLYCAVESGAWKVNVFPVCEKFPCTEAEFKGSWPDRFTYEYVNGVYDKLLKQGRVSAFYQEMMLRVMNNDERLIVESDIRWYKRSELIRNKDNYNFYITTDFATSDKQSADFSSLNVWAVNNNRDWFWVDGVLERQTMDKNIDDLFRLVSQYKPYEVGIEVSGQQGGFIPWIQQEMLTRNTFFALTSSNNSSKPGIRPTVDKLQRFNVIVPWFKGGKIYFPVEWKTHPILKEGINNQLMMISSGGIKAKKDDFIDGTSQIALLNVFYPSANANMRSDGRGVWSNHISHKGDDDDYSIRNYIV